MKTGSGLWGRWRARRARQSRVGRVALWLLEALIVALMSAAIPGAAHDLAVVIAVFCALALCPLLLILLYRWLTQRFLWKVRNRLLLTYLLMGLAPVVLFATLAGITGYVFAGQYATSAALSALDQASAEVKDETASEAALGLASAAKPVQPTARPAASINSRVSLVVLRNGIWRPLINSTANGSRSGIPVENQPSPAWLHPGFHGIVSLDRKLYICSVASVPMGNRSYVALGSMPLNPATLAEMAKGLGSITIYSGFSRLYQNPDDSNVNVVVVKPGIVPKGVDAADFISVKGGTVPRAANFFDVPVLFSAPALSIYSWQTGDKMQGVAVVVSRPAVLYTHLFASSVNMGVAVRLVLIGIVIFFALLEVFALLMAVGLSRTITRSVADLYHGTREIDAGHLEHRIRVARHDQLGALATSFNSMAASVSDLLVQQREKERLINELSIAREVQTNLFPRSPAKFAGFEMHAVCLPARTIGGDYFDFIYSRGGGGQNDALCLAFGDISGKGISAALVMASLHSAVRAFILNSVATEGSAPSPAVLLALINRHLYRSTQVERYATLFLACYDSASRKLTYANGGHLPPLVLSSDGAVRPLDAGGPVVGLLSGLEYVEATVELQPGDLLMAFSDGLTEPEKEGVDYGEERLLAYISENRQLPLPVLAANTLKTVQAWIGDNEQPDDMTLLLARQL